MHFYQEIYNKSAEEVKLLTKKKIEEKEAEKAGEEDQNIIGYKIGHNLEKLEVNNSNGNKTFDLELRCLYNGYLPKSTKIVYGLRYTYDGYVGNDGEYYYLEDDSYIYEFCRFIKDKKAEDEYDLIYLILEFIKNYFGTIKLVSRDDISKLISKDEYTYYEPTKEHELTDFKGKGCALCSEFATMAQNLMSIMGIESYIVIGNESITGQKDEPHAFNLISLVDKDNERRYFVADFLNSIRVYDFDFEPLESIPFLGEIETIDDELLEGLVFNEEKLTFTDYSYVWCGDIALKLDYERERKYYIKKGLSFEKILFKEKQ